MASRGELANGQNYLLSFVKTPRDHQVDKEFALFMSRLGDAFTEKIHTDIQLMPANQGPPLPAHKAVLAVRSEIFKHILDSEEGYKAPPGETLKFEDMNHEELESLLFFLYTGGLPTDKMERHVYALFFAAHKYEIQYLEHYCERHMLQYLNSSNALDVLEMSDTFENKTLKDAALSFIVKNMVKIVFSSKYDSFGSTNPHLCVQITRAFVSDAKKLQRV